MCAFNKNFYMMFLLIFQKLMKMATMRVGKIVKAKGEVAVVSVVVLAVVSVVVSVMVVMKRLGEEALEEKMTKMAQMRVGKEVKAEEEVVEASVVVSVMVVVMKRQEKEALEEEVSEAGMRKCFPRPQQQTSQIKKQVKMQDPRLSMCRLPLQKRRVPYFPIMPQALILTNMMTSLWM